VQAQGWLRKFYSCLGFSFYFIQLYVIITKMRYFEVLKHLNDGADEQGQQKYTVDALNMFVNAF